MKGLYVLKEKRIYKRELPLWGSLLAAVLLAGCITLLALWCQPNALRTVLAVFKAQPLLIVLNALPIGLLLLHICHHSPSLSTPPWQNQSSSLKADNHSSPDICMNRVPDAVLF